MSRAPLTSDPALAAPIVSEGTPIPVDAPTPTARVAVLLASYRGARWIGAQINSVLAQRDVEVQIFVSDDGSDDGTAEIVAGWPDPRVNLLPPRHMGGAGANFLRLLVDAPWDGCDAIAFCDQDDLWHGDKLSRAVAALDTGADGYSANVAAVWFDTQAPPADARRVLIDKAQPQRRMDHLFEAAGPGNSYVLPVAVARRLRDRIRDTDPALLGRIALHDWLIYAMVRGPLIRPDGGRWIIDPLPAVDYRQHDGNVMGYARSLPAIRRRLGLLFGHWYLEQAGLIARIAAITGPEAAFLARPTFTGLATMLRHLGDYRRRRPEAAILAPALIWHWLRARIFRLRAR